MLTFLKERSYDIVKLIINQVAISIFGTAMALATAMIKTNQLAIMVGTSVFSVLFFLFIVYITMWELGAKDSHKIEKNLPGHSRLTGLYIGLFASIPNYLVAILITLGLVTSVPAFDTIHSIVNVVSSFLIKGMYTGLLAIPINETLQLNSLWFMYFLIPLPMIYTSFIAYFAGSKNFKIFGKR